MPWLDPEMTRILDFHVDYPRRRRPARHVGHGRCREDGDRRSSSSSPTDSSAIADVVVLAVGVRPNTELAQQAGVTIGPLGGIAVDAQMRTSVPDILAAGDAVETAHFLTGEPILSMLAGPANREGRIAAETICGRESAYRGTQGTAIVKVFDMAAGGTGLTEAQLRERGIEYRKVYTHHNDHAAYYPGSSPMFIKVALRTRRTASCWAPRCWAGTAWTSASTSSRWRCAPACPSSTSSTSSCPMRRPTGRRRIPST